MRWGGNDDCDDDDDDTTITAQTPAFPKTRPQLCSTTHVTLHNSQKPDTTASALFSDEENDGEMWMW